MRMTISLPAMCIGAMALAAVACGSDETVVTTPTGATYVVDSNTAADAAMYAATDPFDPVVAAAAVTPAANIGAGWASVAAAAAARYYQPSGCVTATANGNTVTYTLNGCSGALGVIAMTGTITATYTPAQPQGVQVAINSSNLRANGVALNLNQTGVYTQSGNARQIATNDKSSATSPSGNVLARTRTGTLAWSKGTTCATWNSAGTLQLDGAPLSEKFSSQTLCTAQCPKGTVVLSNSTQSQTLTLTMDGTSTASYSDSAGKSGTVPIACTP
jgi:hypothetical protein